MWQVVTVERFDDWFLSLNGDEQKSLLPIAAMEFSHYLATQR